MKTTVIDGIQVPICEECGIVMPKYDGAMYGFVSQTRELPKVSQVDGLPGIEMVEYCVCWECYKKSYKERFPDKEVPPDPTIL